MGHLVALRYSSTSLVLKRISDLPIEVAQVVASGCRIKHAVVDARVKASASKSKAI